MKKNELTPADFIKIDYKNTHLLKRFINENGKIIPQRVLNTSRIAQTKLAGIKENLKPDSNIQK